MRILVAILLLAAARAPGDHPRTYLASIQGILLKGDERVENFAISTWGVEFRAVCHLPSGWRIKAGSSLTPNGVLEGEGSQGVTWFLNGSPKELRNIVLITLYGPVQSRDIRSGSGVIPATFKGKATVLVDDEERKIPLTAANVRLTPATRCPR